MSKLKLKHIFSFLAILSLSLVFTGPLPAQNSDNKSDPRVTLGFADWLADQGDYYRAITEYKKVLYFHPNYEKKEWVEFQIGRMYFLGERYMLAKEYLIPITATENSKLRFLNDNWLALTYFENEEYVNSLRLFKKLKNENQQQVRTFDYAIYEGLSTVYLKRFDEAHHLFIQMKSDLDDSLRSEAEYEEFIDKTLVNLGEAKELSKKSTGWAIFWGLIFPGGGHLYLSQWDNALVSMLIVGTTGYLAYDGFKRDSMVQGSIFLGLSSGFYAGSVYSAYRQTKKHNATMGNDQMRAIKRDFKLLNLSIRRNINF